LLLELLEVPLTGRAQAVLGDVPILRYVSRSEPYAGKITVLPQTFQTEPYGIALRDGTRGASRWTARCCTGSCPRRRGTSSTVTWAAQSELARRRWRKPVETG
jgi:hypothetical protein